MPSTRNIDVQQMLKIAPATASGRAFFVGLPVGPAGSPMNSITAGIISAVQEYLRRVHDLDSAPVGTIARAERRRELSEPLLKKLQADAQQIESARSNLQARMRGASATSPWSVATPFYTVMTDHGLIADFKADPKRGLLLEQMKLSPLDYIDQINALERAPRALTKLTAAQYDGLRIALFKASRPNEYETMTVEAEMVQLAVSALRAAVQAIGDAAGTKADVREHAAKAVALAETSDLQWIESDDADESTGTTAAVRALAASV